MALHRMLAGDPADDPTVARLWALSRLCEEYHVTPDEAERMWLDDPEDRAVRILELRAYARAKQQYDQVGGKIEKLEQSDLMDTVIENVFALHKARVAAREADD